MGAPSWPAGPAERLCAPHKTQLVCATQDAIAQSHAAGCSLVLPLGLAWPPSPIPRQLKAYSGAKPNFIPWRGLPAQNKSRARASRPLYLPQAQPQGVSRRQPQCIQRGGLHRPMRCHGPGFLPPRALPARRYGAIGCPKPGPMRATARCATCSLPPSEPGTFPILPHATPPPPHHHHASFPGGRLELGGPPEPPCG